MLQPVEVELEIVPSLGVRLRRRLVAFDNDRVALYPDLRDGTATYCSMSSNSRCFKPSCIRL
jgi:hypothetical protein